MSFQQAIVALDKCSRSKAQHLEYVRHALLQLVRSAIDLSLQVCAISVLPTARCGGQVCISS